MNKVTVSVLSLLLVSWSSALVFKNGEQFAIISVPTGKVVTVSGTEVKADVQVVADTWLGTYSQIFMSLVSGQTTTGREKFVLVPQKQKWNWEENFQERNTSTLSTASLPENTFVLTLDNAGNLTQEIFNGGSSQEWLAKEIEDNRITLQNWGNQQCLKNFDHKNTNLFQLLRKRLESLFGRYKKPVPTPLGILTCSSEDMSQKWLLEEVK